MVLLTSNNNVLKIGDKSPDFLLPGIDGKEHSLEFSKEKKAILVLFMCNHCPYVIPKFDLFVKLQRKYGANGFQLIGINSNDPNVVSDDSFEGMKKTAKEQNFNFPYLFDETQTVAKAYGAVCTPDPFLLNSNFEVVYHGRFDDAHKRPPSESTTHEMEDAIKQLLDGRKVVVKQFPSMGCSIKWKQ